MKNSMRWYPSSFVVLTVGAAALAGERTFLGTITSAGPAPYYANNDFYIPPNSKLTLECTAEANVLTDTRYVKNSYDYDALCPMRCKGVRVPANMMFQTSVSLAVVNERIVLPDGATFFSRMAVSSTSTTPRSLSLQLSMAAR